MAECRSCGAPIVWATSERSGKPMPLNATPLKVITGRGEFVIIKGVARKATPDDARLARDHYTSHHSNCPQADQWRKGQS